MVGEGGLAQGKGREEWNGVVRSPARSRAYEVQGEAWKGGGRDIGGNTTRAGDIRGDNAVTEHQQDRNSTAAEPGERSVCGAADGGVLGVRVAEQLRRDGQRQGGDSTKRGVWVDPATQQVGNIAELDPGAFAFGRG